MTLRKEEKGKTERHTEFPEEQTEQDEREQSLEINTRSLFGKEIPQRLSCEKIEEKTRQHPCPKTFLARSATAPADHVAPQLPVPRHEGRSRGRIDETQRRWMFATISGLPLSSRTTFAPTTETRVYFIRVWFISHRPK